MKSIYNDADLGLVEISIRRGLSRINIKVMPTVIKISAPPQLAGDVEITLKENKVWIEEAKKKLAARSGEKIKLTKDSRIKTLTCDIVFSEANIKEGTWSAKLTDNLLSIRYCPTTDFEHNYTQKIIWKLITHFLKQEAARVLPKMLQAESERTGLKYKSVRINSAKWSWGVFSYRGEVALSCYLLLLEEHLVRFVITHELCHSIEMNHSSRFYALLEKHYPNTKVINKELKLKSKAFHRYMI